MLLYVCINENFIIPIESIIPMKSIIPVTMLSCKHSEGALTVPSGGCRLEVVVDTSGLTDKVLEVMSVSPEPIQKQLIGFLPEITAEEDYEVRCVRTEALTRMRSCFIHFGLTLGMGCLCNLFIIFFIQTI